MQNVITSILLHSKQSEYIRRYLHQARQSEGQV